MRSPLRHEPAAWSAAHTLNACSGCMHACGCGEDLCCRHPEVTQANAGTPPPCDHARGSSGLCGREARFLDMPSWH